MRRGIRIGARVGSNDDSILSQRLSPALPNVGVSQITERHLAPDRKQVMINLVKPVLRRRLHPVSRGSGITRAIERRSGANRATAPILSHASPVGHEELYITEILQSLKLLKCSWVIPLLKKRASGDDHRR